MDDNLIQLNNSNDIEIDKIKKLDPFEKEINRFITKDDKSTIESKQPQFKND
jgi:hypothetical protein